MAGRSNQPGLDVGVVPQRGGVAGWPQQSTGGGFNCSGETGCGAGCFRCGNEQVRQIMALKFKFKTKDEVPADQAALYVERDGAWVLDAEGVVEKAKLDEFRSSNVALMKERDEL